MQSVTRIQSNVHRWVQQQQRWAQRSREKRAIASASPTSVLELPPSLARNDMPPQAASLGVNSAPSQAEACSARDADISSAPRPLAPAPAVGPLPQRPAPVALPLKSLPLSDPTSRGHESILVPSPPPQPPPSPRQPSLLELRRREYLAASKARRRLIDEAAACEAGRHADFRRRAAALYAPRPPAHRPPPALSRGKLLRPSSAREAAPDLSVSRLRQQSKGSLPLPTRPTKAELKSIRAFIVRREAWSVARRWGDERVRVFQL